MTVAPNAEESTKSPPRDSELYGAYAVEGGLGVVALFIAWPTGISLMDKLGFSARNVAWGCLGTLPMLVFWLVLTWCPWRPIVRIREVVRAFARELLLKASWLQVALLCALAGIGEELLFRGALQTLLARYTTEALGIVLAGVLFGAVHFVTPTYFVLAVTVGCYLGWLYAATGSLAAPIVTHALYDFVALVVVLRSVRRESEGHTNSPGA
jgi:membrane protease YdiL (CAAX protease family)